MPLDDLASSFGRLIADIAIRLVGEILIQGVGYVICKPFKPNVSPDGALAFLVGLAFWLSFGYLGYILFK